MNIETLPSDVFISCVSQQNEVKPPVADVGAGVVALVMSGKGNFFCRFWSVGHLGATVAYIGWCGGSGVDRGNWARDVIYAP